MSVPMWECRNCGHRAPGASEIAPGPPDWCEGECSVGFDQPQLGDWHEVVGWADGEAEAIVGQLEPQFRALARKFASR